MKKTAMLFGVLLVICSSYLLYTVRNLKNQMVASNAYDIRLIREYSSWGFDTASFSKMYSEYIQETKDVSLLAFPFKINSLKIKHDNILTLLQSDYATKVAEKKETVQSKLEYLRDRVKNSDHLSSGKKLNYSDDFEVIAGTIFERNSTLSDLNTAIKTLENKDGDITKEIEAVRKESVYSEITTYIRSCDDLRGFFTEKSNQGGLTLVDSCINEANKLLGPGYQTSGADFIEVLGRERVFAIVQKATLAKQQIIQDEQYSLLQKKREEEKLTIVPPSPRQDGKVVVVNIGLQRLYAYEDGKSLFATAVPITTGKYGFETVYGEFAIYLKERMHQMRSPFPGIYYDDIVNYWMPFYLGYGLHDAPWRSVYGTQDYSSVGSHGCVNIPLNETSILYNWAQVGTKVLVL